MLTDDNTLSNLSRLNIDVNLRVHRGVRKVVNYVTTLMNPTQFVAETLINP
jgi:hypothetical protein